MKINQHDQKRLKGMNSLDPYATLCFKHFENFRNNSILISTLIKSSIVQILLYGSEGYSQTINKIIPSVIDFITQSKHFNDSLINHRT